MTIQLDQIRLKQGHKHVVNYVRINNLASIHFDHKKKSSWFGPNGFGFKTKTLGLKPIKNLSLVLINPRLLTKQA